MAVASDRKRRFDELLWPHLRAAYNVARWLVRNDHDAEDIVQESFVKAFLAMDGMRGGDSRVWLLAIVRNTAMSLLRRRGSDPSTGRKPQFEPSDQREGVEQALLAAERRDEGRAAIDRLPAEFRETLILRELEALSYKEIAGVLDVPVGTVMSRLARARKLLIEDLTPEKDEAMTCHEAEPLLNPYLDSELDLPTAVLVEQHIAGCSACGREYRDLEALHRQIAEADLTFSPGPALARRVSSIRQLGVVPLWRRQATVLTAVAAVILLVLVPFRLLRTSTADDREIVNSHLRSLMASHLIDVPSSDQHTVKPWFQGRLSFSPEVKDLSPQGFVLAGGRLEMIRRGPAAALVYRRRNHVINLFVASAGQTDSPPRAGSIEGYNLVTWVAGGLHYWAVSDLNGADLMQFAQLIQAPLPQP